MVNTVVIPSRSAACTSVASAKVHGTVGVTLHQFIESRKIVIDDGKNGDRIRPDQSPCWSQLSRVAEQVKQLGENRSGRPERETQALECRDTSFVPLVVLIEEGEQSAGVGKSLNAHVDPATPLARDCLPVPLDSDRPPRIDPAQRSAWLRIRSWEAASSPFAELRASQSVTIVRSKLATLVSSARAALSSASFSAASSRQL